MKRAYYNDNDPYICEWARNLVRGGLVPDGDIDCRSILDIDSTDLHGFRQCHFFCGILGWPFALALAGWPDDRSVWTGSCPCQPFSSAGRQSGSADKRHLWPAWFRLIRECRPDTIFGEQVEGAVGFGWIDRVFADLEAEGYACGAAILGAHSVNAPHIRQRLFWVAQSESQFNRRRGAGTGRWAEFANGGATGGLADAGRKLPRSSGSRPAAGAAGGAEGEAQQRQRIWPDPDAGGTVAGGLGEPIGARLEEQRGYTGVPRQAGSAEPGEAAVGADASDGSRLADAADGGHQSVSRISGVRATETGNLAVSEFGTERAAGGVADADNDDRQRRAYSRTMGRAQSHIESEKSEIGERRETTRDGGAIGGLGDAASVGRSGRRQPQQPWQDSVWLPCLDGKARRIEPSIQPLAHAGEWGTGSRVGILRGAGNAIVPALAAEFIRAVMEVI